MNDPSMMMLPINMRSFFGDQNEATPKGPRPLLESQIVELREIFKYYRQCPFKAGDLVTPRANVGIRDAGEPHLVLEVLDNPAIFDMGNAPPSSNKAGMRLDVRVGSLADNNVNYVAHWAESWQFILYVDADVSSAPESAPANAE